MASEEQTRNRQKNFKITENEVNLLKEALKNEEFRKLLVEYSKEIKNDTENSSLQEIEILELERQQGYDVVFIVPIGSYVIKVWTTCGRKVMINICTSSAVNVAYCEQTNKSGQNWNIPYMTGSFRLETDRKNQTCEVVDIIFHDQTLELANSSPAFRKILHTTALDATESSINFVLNREHVKFPKLKYKGSVKKCIVRTPKKVVPTHEVVYRENSLGVKTALIIKIQLPLLTTAVDCNLEVTDTTLHLDHEKYVLALQLPTKINSALGKANFDGNMKILIIELPTYENTQSTIPLANNSINNVAFGVEPNMQEIDSLAAQCEAMSVNGSDTVDSSDSEGMKCSEFPVQNVNENTATTESKVQNLNNKDTNQHIQTSESHALSNGSKDENKAVANNNNYWNDCSQKNGNHGEPAKKLHRQYPSKTRSFSESSDDWAMSRSPFRGILKSYSLSSDMSQSLEHSEETEGGLSCPASNNSSSVKKSVSFSDVISKQLFRADSSILGQRKKNQRKARNKRKNTTKRQNSESEDVFSEPESSTTPNTMSSAPLAFYSEPKEAKAAEFISDLMFDIDM
ncbi:hypothetical protein B566_EDAN003836 [Ephemera danica]|nr:hypothetical protein B566_EDAN003836 [Ephemera danica]